MSEIFRIPMTNRPGAFSLVDKDTFEWASLRRWHQDRYGYAVSTFPVDVTNKRFTKRFLHRLVMKAPDGLHVDHINHDPMDNRRANLRVCTNQENAANRPKKSGYGPGIQERNGRWNASLYIGRALYNIGSFERPEDAVAARRKVFDEIRGLVKELTRIGA